MKSLKQKTISGVKWSVLSKIMQKVISVGTFAILARILKPSDFGLFALAFVALDSLSIFKSFGIDSALIQRKENVEEAFQTAFFLIIAMAAILFIFGWACAPWAARFFGNTDVRRVIQVLVASYLFSYFAKVPDACIEKAMRFSLSNIIDFVGSAANSVFAILFALISPSVWSLVWAYLIKQVVMMVLSWRFAGFRVRWYFNWKIAKELIGFGKFMTALGIVWYVSANIDDIVIGKILGAAMLGYYALANNIGNFINTHFTFMVSKVMFPAYSGLQGDGDSLKRVYLKTIKFVSMLSVPFSLSLIFLADEFVSTLYGARWITIIPLIRLFGVIQLIAPIKACSSPVFMGQGRPDYTFKLTFFYLLFRMPFLIFFTQKWGLNGAVISELIAVISFAPINLGLAKKLVGFTYKEIFGQILPSVYCSLIMVAAFGLAKGVFAFGSAESLMNVHFVRFGILAAFGGIAYIAAWYVIDRTVVTEVKHMILNGGNK